MFYLMLMFYFLFQSNNSSALNIKVWLVEAFSHIKLVDWAPEQALHLHPQRVLNMSAIFGLSRIETQEEQDWQWEDVIIFIWFYIVLLILFSII